MSETSDRKYFHPIVKVKMFRKEPEPYTISIMREVCFRGAVHYSLVGPTIFRICIYSIVLFLYRKRQTACVLCHHFSVGHGVSQTSRDFLFSHSVDLSHSSQPRPKSALPVPNQDIRRGFPLCPYAIVLARLDSYVPPYSAQIQRESACNPIALYIPRS